MNRTERLEALAAAVIPEAVEWVAELRKYRTYQGKDPEYFRKARLGLGVVGSSVRLCATIENSRGNDLVAERLRAISEGELSNRAIGAGELSNRG
jgi:hypothetical protein